MRKPRVYTPTQWAAIRCVEGRLFRHDPQFDDPDLETDVGQCEECLGKGCDQDENPIIDTEQSGHGLSPTSKGI